MISVWQMLERMGLYHPFTADDVINAEQDNAIHEHRQVVQQVSEAVERRKKSNSELRKSIQEAKRSIALMGAALEDFEVLLEADHERLRKGK